MTSHR